MGDRTSTHHQTPMPIKKLWGWRSLFCLNITDYRVHDFAVTISRNTVFYFLTL